MSAARRMFFRVLGGIKGVSEAHITFGTYDVLAKVDADSPEKVKEIVFSKIRTLEYVRSTLTLIVVEK